MLGIGCKELVQYLDKLLASSTYLDFCPNGLQVQGKEKIKKVVSGVTASQELIDAAISMDADLLLVHHGYFWKGEDPCIVGIKQQRLLKLLKNDINLLAYHLPLDCHAAFGNNVQLAKHLGILPAGHWLANGMPIVFHGSLSHPVTGENFQLDIKNKLQRSPLYIPGKKKLISTVAWCTGAAQDYIDIAIANGVDAYITGEVSERTVHVARESGIHFYAAGHHATERYGVKALGEHVAEQFNIEHHFVDKDNPA